MLDGFFASVCGSLDLIREVSDRAFAKAREHLHLPALNSLNELVVRRADEAGLPSSTVQRRRRALRSMESMT
jgi:hypothetical protein